MSLFDRDDPNQVDQFERHRRRNQFFNHETWAIVKAMKATGNRPGVIAAWKEVVAAWAQMNRTDPNAAAANAWLPMWQPRPFYTAEELAPMWPALAIAIGHTATWPNVLKSARRLEFELDFAGLPHFNMHGHKYYLVERIHFWQKASQEERENAMYGNHTEKNPLFTKRGYQRRPSRRN